MRVAVQTSTSKTRNHWLEPEAPYIAMKKEKPCNPKAVFIPNEVYVSEAANVKSIIQMIYNNTVPCNDQATNIWQ